MRKLTGLTAHAPRRGWVMVRARRLSADELIRALAAGDFIATTGVVLRELRHDAQGIDIEILAQPGVTYTTQFIGTRTGSTAVGEVLAQVAGVSPRYLFRDDERYVRAKIIASSGQAAWLQPIFR